jgi:hypothetical protein
MRRIVSLLIVLTGAAVITSLLVTSRPSSVFNFSSLFWSGPAGRLPHGPGRAG